jgi:hypothetical protein
MKIKIGPYKNWFGPYQLAELLCFWAKDQKDEYGFKMKPDWVHKFGEWLAYGNIELEPEIGESNKWPDNRNPTLLYKLLLWINNKKNRRVSIKIDAWDTWSMDHTLALIIVPMLQQLKATKHGSPHVDDEDVPEELKSTSVSKLTQEQKNTGDSDNTVHSRWDWVLNEIIYSFQCELDEDWESQFYSGEHDINWEKQESGLFEMKNGPNDTWSVDRTTMDEAWARRKNGLRLFAKFYNGIWD